MPRITERATSQAAALPAMDHPPRSRQVHTMLSVTAPPIYCRPDQTERERTPALQTSCCSTDSERSHRCCHLPNETGSCRIFPILHNEPGMPPPLNGLSPGRTGTQPHTYGSFRHPNPHCKRHLDWFSRL